MKLSLLLLLTLLVLCESEGGLGSRILAVLPSYPCSHFIFCHSILAELACRGHKINIYSRFSAQYENAYISYVQVQTKYDSFLTEGLTYNMLISATRLQFLGMALALFSYYSQNRFFLKTPQLQALLASTDKYDLVISEGSRGQEYMLVFGSKFRAPNVVFWTTGAADTLNSYTGNSLSIAHIPDYFSYATTDQGAADGVIYFSLGSVIPDHCLPQELLQVFINVFKHLPQKVVWKVSPDKLPEFPDHILVAKWLPQQSILNHPACRLFVTHGGLHSVFEAWDAGVPVVGIPIVSDQPNNIRQCERLKVGVTLDITTLTEKNFAAAIHTVLSNHSYKENAVRVSKMFRNVALPPRDLAVYWIEYAMRHRGAAHLRPSATQLPLYQRTLLHVIAVILCGMLLSVLILFILISKFTYLRLKIKKY